MRTARRGEEKETGEGRGQHQPGPWTPTLMKPADGDAGWRIDKQKVLQQDSSREEKVSALESKLPSRHAPAFITNRPSADLHCSLTKTLKSRPQPSEPLGPWLQALGVIPGAGPDLAQRCQPTRYSSPSRDATGS